MSEEKLNRQSIISNSDADLADLIATQPTEEQISIKLRREINGWELPEEAKKLEGVTKKFRWLSRDKRYLIRNRAKGWLICNRTNSPFLPKEGFAVHGGYQNAMYPDHILGYMNIEMAKAITKDQSDSSRDAVKHYTEDIKKDPRFYDAKIGGDDSDDNPKGLTQGRDF